MAEGHDDRHRTPGVRQLHGEDGLAEPRGGLDDDDRLVRTREGEARPRDVVPRQAHQGLPPGAPVCTEYTKVPRDGSLDVTSLDPRHRRARDRGVVPLQ